MSKNNLFILPFICIWFLFIVISCNDSSNQETEKLRKEVSDLKKEKDTKTVETKDEPKTEEAEDEEEPMTEEPKNEPENDKRTEPKNNPNIVTAKQINGTWSYGGNRIKIWALGGGNLRMQLESNGEVNSVREAYIDGTEGTHKPFDDCYLTFNFDAGYLYFSIDGSKGGSSAECGDFEGRYTKTSSAKPTFDKEDRWRDVGN